MDDELGAVAPINTAGTSSPRRVSWTDGLGVTVLSIAALALGACSNTSGSTPPQSAATSGSSVYRWGVVGNKGAISQLQLETPTPIAGIRGRVVQIATSNSDGYA